MPDTTEAKVRALAERCGIRLRHVRSSQIYGYCSPAIYLYYPDKDWAGPLTASTWYMVRRAVERYAHSKGIPVEEDFNG